jgi:hypothetical protein
VSAAPEAAPAGIPQVTPSPEELALAAGGAFAAVTHAALQSGDVATLGAIARTWPHESVLQALRTARAAAPAPETHVEPTPQPRVRRHGPHRMPPALWRDLRDEALEESGQDLPVTVLFLQRDTGTDARHSYELTSIALRELVAGLAKELETITTPETRAAAGKSEFLAIYCRHVLGLGMRLARHMEHVAVRARREGP